MRIGDPAVISPVVATFSKIVGFEEFSKRLAEKRRSDPDFAELRIDRQYAGRAAWRAWSCAAATSSRWCCARPIRSSSTGSRCRSRRRCPGRRSTTTTAMAGARSSRSIRSRAGRSRSRATSSTAGSCSSATRTGTARCTRSGARPARSIPRRASRATPSAACSRPSTSAGRFRSSIGSSSGIDKEDIASFNKFLQGYYDASGIIQESFDRAVQNGGLSPAMEARGMALAKSVEPAIFYIGFNMKDPVVGAPGGERARKLRQAMSLAIDAVEFLRIFNNGRDVPAQSPIPPGIFGYDPAYTNPYRKPDLERARALLAEAGYRGGIDPKTQRPLRLTFDAGSPDTRSRLRYQFWVDSWRRIGLDVEIAAQHYNAFQDKVRRGAFQIYTWGWIADYPDPENFLFLLWGPNANATNPGAPNTSSFADPALRRAVPRDEGHAERAGADAEDRRDARDPRARAPVDRALPYRGLCALPRLDPQREAGRHEPADRQVRRHRSAAAPRAARRVEPPDRVAGVGARGRVRGDRDARAWSRSSGSASSARLRGAAARLRLPGRAGRAGSPVRAVLPVRRADRHGAPCGRREGAARSAPDLDRAARLRPPVARAAARSLLAAC